MYYIESQETDPRYNLALEQYVFDRLDRRHSYCMLWRNERAVIVGKHQNTAAEIDASYIAANDVAVVRRLSGGGAVYHDLGNLNFTFIADAAGGAALDFAAFCRPVAEALGLMGVAVELSGRNDMTIEGRKFSGNAQYLKEGRVMHHGTLLFDSDLDAVGQALQVSGDKISAKGVRSVRSRVTNIRPHLAKDCDVLAFRDALREALIAQNGAERYTLTKADEQAVRHLRDTVYSCWDWNYGASPPHSTRKRRRIEGVGEIEVSMEVVSGCLQAIAFRGDYFGSEDTLALEARLCGCALKDSDLRERLAQVEVGRFFHNLDAEELVELLLR